MSQQAYSQTEFLVDGAIRPPSLPRRQLMVDVPLRWALLAAGLWLAYRSQSGLPFNLAASGAVPRMLAAYTVLAVLSTIYWLRAARRGEEVAAELQRISLVLFAVDVVVAGALIWRDGGVGSSLYILFVLLAIKAVSLAPFIPWLLWAPFAFGPLYALAIWLASGSLAFLADPAFLSRYVLFLAWLIGATIIGHELRRRTTQTTVLAGELAQQKMALAHQTEVLQHTTGDLANRLLELRALQEVAKALATTLRTEETLQLVVERLADATGSSHCAVALVDRESATAAREGAALEGAIFGDGLTQPTGFRVALAQEPVTLAAFNSSRPIRVSADRAGRLGARLGGHSYYVTALVSRGHAIGALYVAENGSTKGAAKEDEGGTKGNEAGRGSPTALNTSEQLLTSFAYFAATALENARLYQDAFEKRRELEAVLAGIGDGVVVAGTDLSLVLMNPVARDILGLESEPPGGVPLQPYLSDPSFAALLSNTLETGQEQIRELDLPAFVPSAAGGQECDGSRATSGVRTYGALASPILNSSAGVSGVVAVLRDITAQKEVERMKSNFLSVVSHELRTPLHSIKGFVEIILMGKTGPITELQEDFLKTVRSQTTVLQRMIDDLLEFSRMEAGRIKLNIEEVALPALAHSVANKLAPLAEEAELCLFTDFPEDLPNIEGDRVRLEQVLTNLVENAIKFTPAHGEITIGARYSGNGSVRLTVHDTGIGIPPDEQEKIFDRFYQVERGENRSYRGTGLGLSISKHIVERHSGSIWVESAGMAGLGSSFHVELPLELRHAEAPTIDFSPARRAMN